MFDASRAEQALQGGPDYARLQDEIGEDEHRRERLALAADKRSRVHKRKPAYQEVKPKWSPSVAVL